MEIYTCVLVIREIREKKLKQKSVMEAARRSWWDDQDWVALFS